MGLMWDFGDFLYHISIIMLKKDSSFLGFCAEKSLAINRSSPLGEIRRLEILERKMFL